MAINGWKVTAIIFIVLFGISAIYISFMYDIGTTSLNNELQCSNEICYNRDASSFKYEPIEKICQCYDGEKMFYMEYMK